MIGKQISDTVYSPYSQHKAANRRQYPSNRQSETGSVGSGGLHIVFFEPKCSNAATQK